MRKPVYQALESLRHMVHECISLNDNQDPTQGYYPYRTDLARFSNQYGDIRNVPSILIEQHALHPYKTQVLGNYVMLKAMFEVIGEQAASLRQAIASDRERLLRQKEVILTWKPGETAETPFVVGDYRYEQSPVTGPHHRLEQPAEDAETAGDRQRRTRPGGAASPAFHRPGAVARSDRPDQGPRHPLHHPGASDRNRRDPVPHGRHQARRWLRTGSRARQPDSGLRRSPAAGQRHAEAVPALADLPGRLAVDRHRPAAGRPGHRPAATAESGFVLVLGLLQFHPGGRRGTGGNT